MTPSELLKQTEEEFEKEFTNTNGLLGNRQLNRFFVADYDKNTPFLKEEDVVTHLRAYIRKAQIDMAKAVLERVLEIIPQDEWYYESNECTHGPEGFCGCDIGKKINYRKKIEDTLLKELI